jgi:hypothetical protein
MFDLTDPCIRASWGTLIPAAFVALFLLASIPTPRLIENALAPITKPFRTFVTLSEAEAIQAQANGDNDTTAAESTVKPITYPTSPPWRTFVLAGIVTSEILVWLIVGLYSFAVHPQRDAWTTAIPFVIVGTWTYAAVRIIFFARQTPHYDLLVLFLAEFVSSILGFGGVLFSTQVKGTKAPAGIIIVHLFNVVVVLVLLIVTLSTPIAVPSIRVKREELGRTLTPEDHTTLWSWLSFSWMSPIIAKGTNTTLNEDDIWTLSPTLQSRVLFTRFTEEKRATLLGWIVLTNMLDNAWDFTLS